MASATQSAGPPAGEGKKQGKKNKGVQKMSAEEFLGPNVSSGFKMNTETSWADIMDDEDVVTPMSLMSMGPVSLPSAPKSLQGPDIDLDSIPHVGPFKAQIANLQYETTEEQLQATLFPGLAIKHLILHGEGRPNGTASVEFETRNDLIAGLGFNNKQLGGRTVRVFLPNQDRYGDRGGRGGPRGNYVDNTPVNWRSADRSAPAARADGSFPEKKVYPPPTSSYGDSSSRGYGSRPGGGRYGGDGEGSYRAPRQDYGGGFGGGRRDYDRDGGDRRRDDGGFGGRDGPRRDRFGGDEGRASGNWQRGPPRDAEGAAPQEESSNWRSARAAEGGAPPPSNDRYERRDNGRYGEPRDRDHNMPPSRDSYGPRSGGDGGYRRRDDDGYDRSGPRDREFDRAPARGDDLYDPAPRRTSGGDDYEAPRSFAPAPPRDRAMSGRSDRSNPDHHSHDLPLSGAPKDDEPPRRSRPPELRPEMLANILGGAEEETTNKPASYSSIFGSAKPVDTLKREMEIEKKIAEERAAAAEKEAAAKEAAAAAGGATSPAPGSDSGASRSDRPPRRDGPRPDGAAPPRMRRENGEGGGPRGGDRDRPRRNDRYEDRNGMGGGGLRRDGGGERRNRMGPDGAGSGGPGGAPRRPREGGYSGGGGYGGDSRGGSRGFGGDRDGRPREGGPRYREEDGPGTRYYGRGGGAGSGGRDYDYERSRFASDSDDKVDGVKTYTTTNKYQYLPETEDHVSD